MSAVIELTNLIASRKKFIRDNEILEILYKDSDITNTVDFCLAIKSIAKSFRFGGKNDFWVTLGKLRVKKSLPGRTSKFGWYCGHDNLIKTFLNWPCDSESNMRRLFGYVHQYNLNKLIGDIYQLETGDSKSVDELKKSIVFKYYGNIADWSARFLQN